MKIESVTLHNFRSYKDATIFLCDYSLLIGENNVGKTGFISALRMFYEDDGLKYTPARDFPKFDTDDEESWMEISYLIDDDEYNGLKEEYRSSDYKLKVRKYFKGNKAAANQSNIYAYENGVLSENLFYGAKNISQAKLGKVIYIPEISTADDTLKLSGPSPFREMVNFVMKKAIKDSSSFKALEQAFDIFNKDFRDEEATKEEGLSIKHLVNDINVSIGQWQIEFGIDINPIKPEEITKNLLAHYIEDENLDGKRVSINSYGQGLQRHLIFTLIRLSSKYSEKKIERKKDFNPDFVLILFEEPEAFLHPAQQEILNINLQKLSQEDNQQLVITTHSPTFASRNIEDLKCMIRLDKKGAVTSAYQLSLRDITDLFDENLSMFKFLSSKSADMTVPIELRKQIIQRQLGDPNADLSKKLEEESIKYFLWLDSERSSLFFAKHIIICEGATEKVLLDYLINNIWIAVKEKHIYFLDAMGKYNIHRYMNLFNKLGLSHSVLMDADEDRGVHGIINEFINNNKNIFTKEIYAFDKDIEDFLDIPVAPRPDLKPLNIMYCYNNCIFDSVKLDKLFEVLLTLI